MLFCILTFNLWLHFNKLLTYLLTYLLRYEGRPKIKIGSSWFPQTPFSRQFFLYRELVRVNAYKCAKLQLPGFISFRDKEVVLKFNVGATSPLPYPIRWKFHVCSKYLARSNSLPNFSIVSLWIMQLCAYVFSISFPLYISMLKTSMEV